LELGSYNGDFTSRLVDRFQNITCVEASDEAAERARSRIGGKAEVVVARFESVSLPRRFDNVVLTHVLEHLDDPVAVLRRVNDEWLSDTGRLFLVCPNANAPSRQIAVRMGIISHNSAVTPAEEKHGHRITYTLDTLERDAKRAGLQVIYRSGIFFKALANYQWTGCWPPTLSPENTSTDVMTSVRSTPIYAPAFSWSAKRAAPFERPQWRRPFPGS